MRTPDDQMDLPGLPELVIGGLDEMTVHPVPCPAGSTAAAGTAWP